MMSKTRKPSEDSPQEERQQSESADIERIVQELQGQPSYSAQIRYLAAQGFRRSSIAHILSEMRGYPMSSQHVNNVLARPLKGTGQGGRLGRPPVPEDPRARELIRSLPKAKPVLVKRDELEARRKQKEDEDGETDE